MSKLIYWKLNLSFFLLLSSHAINAQTHSFSVNFGTNFNQTLIIMPNVYFSETVYSTSPVIGVNYQFGGELISYDMGISWAQIQNVFAYDYIPFAKQTDSKRPSLKVDEWSISAAIKCSLFTTNRFRLYSGLGLNVAYYETLSHINVRIPLSGVIDIPLKETTNGQTISYTFNPSRDEYRSWNFGPTFYLESLFELTQNVMISLRVGGKLMVLDAFQNRVDYTIKGYPNTSIDVTTHMDLKNTGSYFFLQAGVVYEL